MSVLTKPRIYFAGLTDWNPNTVNNSPLVYDDTTSQPIPQAGVPFDDFVKWLTELNAAGTAPNGSWNVFGDHACSFIKAVVTGVQLTDESNSGDPLAGTAVQLLGQQRGKSSTPARLVDVNPYGSTTSQVFYESFSIGASEPGATPALGFTARGACRMFSRWPNFGRNLQQLPIAGSMGVIWQTAARTADIVWYGLDESPALAALKEAVESSGNQGIVMQFASYRTLYYQNASYKNKPIRNGADLSAAYLDGFQGANPATSVLLGSMGVWGPGELASAPVDRLLAPAAAVAPVAMVVDPRRAVQEGSLKAVPSVQPVSLGPAMAAVDCAQNVVTVGFIATFPEENANLDKVDLGTFILQLEDANGKTTPVGQPLTYAQYAKVAYEGTAGIVEFSFDPSLAEQIESGKLSLVQESSSAAALTETLLVAETDQRGTYLDQSETKTIAIRVYERGRVPSTPINLLIAQYDNQGNLIQQPADRFVAVTPDTGVGKVEGGSVSIQVNPLQPGTCALGFFPYQGETPPTPPQANFPGVTDSYVVIRTLPFDDVFKDHPPDESLSWSFLYATTLRNYDVIYPIMSTIFSLGNQQSVDSHADAIQQAISPAVFESTLAMPITRELSAGKRILLQRYLERVSSSTGVAFS